MIEFQITDLVATTNKKPIRVDMVTKDYVVCEVEYKRYIPLPKNSIAYLWRLNELTGNYERKEINSNEK